MALPIIPDDASLQDVIAILQQFTEEVRRLEERIKPSAGDWSNITNVTEDRAFDADSTSVAELADNLGTLISDLSDMGLLGQ